VSDTQTTAQTALFTTATSSLRYTSSSQIDPVTGQPLAQPHYLVDVNGNPISSFGGGQQYTDGAAAPTHPIGTELIYNNGGTMTAVSAASGLPITGSISATNPSVGTDGTAGPASSTQIGGQTGGGVLTSLFVDSSGRLYVNVNSMPAITGTVTEANSAGIRSDLDTLITNTADLLADGDNLATIATNTTSIATSALQTTGNTSLSSIATNTARLPAQGAAATSASTPVTIASDQIVPVKGSFTEQASLSAGSLNADLVPSTDVSAYKSFSLTINANAYSGTLTFAISNDGVTFTSTEVVNAATGTATTSTTNTSITYIGHLATRYLRVRMTSYTSGTAQATLELYTSPLAPLSLFVAQSGIWSIGITASPIASMVEFHLISAATTNATSVKASGGQLYGFSICNTNAAFRYVKLYNKATAPTVGTDTPVRTLGIPPNGSIHLSSTTGIRFGTGIALATTTGIADSDNTAVGASDLAIDLDYI
jgi:hypothetical protein